jgi:hypothetical protein
MDQSTIRWTIIVAALFGLVIWMTLGAPKPDVGHFQSFRAL